MFPCISFVTNYLLLLGVSVLRDPDFYYLRAALETVLGVRNTDIGS